MAAGTLQMVRDRLFDLGATIEAVDRAYELESGTLGALVELDAIAESYEDEGSKLPEICKTPECHAEIVARLRTVERARSAEQEFIREDCGEKHVAETMPEIQGGQRVFQETGRPRVVVNGHRPPAIVSELCLLVRAKHPAVYDRWFKSWGREIHDRR